MKKYFLQFEGEQHEVELQEKDGKIALRVGEVSHQFEVLLNKNPLYTFLIDGHEVLDVEANFTGDKCSLHLGHYPYAIKVIDPLKDSLLNDGGSGAGAGLIEALMSGKVIDIKVAIGDAVNKDQVALIVEAMKMQNEIGCPIEGNVKNIFVKIGDSVEAGQKLIEIGHLS